MSRRVKRAREILAAGTVILSSATGLAEELIQGRVVDTGKAEPADGIGGVSVSILETMTRKSVGEGITDGNGEYKIEIKGPIKNKLVAAFSKLGYFARPTYQSVTLSADVQPSVKLAKENADEAYYKATASNIQFTYSKDPGGMATYFSAVASLPANQKQTVADELKLKDVNAWKSFMTADKTLQSTQEVLTKYKPTKGGLFGAYANYGEIGTVWLYGEVPSVDEKKGFEKAIKASMGVTRVQNDLAVSITR